MDKYSAFIIGLIIGFFAGSIGWAVATYAVLTIKDWIRKRREGDFKLGSNMKKGPSPELMSLDED